jgi:hypothetical protein
MFFVCADKGFGICIFLTRILVNGNSKTDMFLCVCRERT